MTQPTKQIPDISASDITSVADLVEFGRRVGVDITHLFDPATGTIITGGTGDLLDHFLAAIELHFMPDIIEKARLASPNLQHIRAGVLMLRMAEQLFDAGKITEEEAISYCNSAYHSVHISMLSSLGTAFESVASAITERTRDSAPTQTFKVTRPSIELHEAIYTAIIDDAAPIEGRMETARDSLVKHYYLFGIEVSQEYTPEFKPELLPLLYLTKEEKLDAIVEMMGMCIRPPRTLEGYNEMIEQHQRLFGEHRNKRRPRLERPYREFIPPREVDGSGIQAPVLSYAVRRKGLER